ncbi:hypothetical protein EON66_05420 [archaeon]|nr:MAG: hypothetical protein EON66_05420 [archaeon]
MEPAGARIVQRRRYHPRHHTPAFARRLVQVNKAVVTTWNFPGLLTLLTAQSLVTIGAAALLALPLWGNPFQLTPITPALLKAYVR